MISTQVNGTAAGGVFDSKPLKKIKEVRMCFVQEKIPVGRFVPQMS